MRNRAAEAKTSSIRKMLVEHNILAGHGLCEQRVEKLRRARSDAAERQDLFTDYQHVRGEQERERRIKIVEAEERMADELSKRKAAKTRDEMNRRRVCDESEELRILKERLHAAKVTKERSQQLIEKQVRLNKERLHDHKIAEYMENERLEQMEMVHKLEIEKAAQRERVKSVNQQQMAQKEALREEAMEEYLKEKDQVEHLVEKIQREDAQEQAARQKKSRETQEQMLDFLEMQKRTQEQMEEEERRENERIENFAREKAHQEEELQHRKLQEMRERERAVLAMISQQESHDRHQKELDQLRNDLRMEELEDEVRRREQEQARKKVENREGLKQAYAQQMNLRDLKRAEEKEEEDKFREQVLAKFADDDRIEQLNDQKRRIKVQEHIREANRLIDIRREKYEAAREAEIASAEVQRREDAERLRIIEEERQRLLKEAACPLRDFLPKGTMECKNDYTLVYHDRVPSGGS